MSYRYEHFTRDLYVMDRDGTVAFRALWSNHEGVVREGLELVADWPTEASRGSATTE